MNRDALEREIDALEREIDEIELLLVDDQLAEADRFALYGAQQALRWVLDSATWQPASQTFYRVGDCPLQAVSDKQQ